MYRKRMSEALEEARSYRDPVNEDKGFSSQQIKMAYGVLNDPRYKQGNYSGAYAAIEKIAKGLANHPDVANALRRANEELEEETIKEYKKMTVTFNSMADMSKASTDLAKYGFTINAKGMVMKVDGKGADLNAIGTDLQNFYGAKVVAENLDEKFTKKEFDRNEDENDHSLNAIMLAKEFGTSQEIKDMEDIDKRHKQRGHITDPDYSKRNALVRKYYPRLK